MLYRAVGGGISSTSKVCIIEKSARPGHDVDYTFGQVDMRSGAVDWSGSCGNLAAAVGLYAMREGLVGHKDKDNQGLSAGGEVVVFQTNLQYSMRVRVGDEDGAEECSIPGVEATGRPIAVNFVRPRVGGLPLLPTGNVTDTLTLGVGDIEASLVCAGNPTIFVRAADLGLDMRLAFPLRCDEGRLQAMIDDLRRQGSEQMGVPLTDAVRVSWVAPPARYTTSDAQTVHESDMDLVGCVTTPGRLHHHAFTGTGAINLACLAALPGSVAHSLMGAGACGGAGRAQVRLGQPAGVMRVEAECTQGAGGEWEVVSAGFTRTAKLLFSGSVHV